jgi:hypothetical protein
MKAILSVLSLCIIICANAMPVDNRDFLSALQQRIASLEIDTEHAEAIRAVKRLQRAYGHYAEFGLWHDVADLFSEEGIGIRPSGDSGKEGIGKKFLREIGGGKLGLPAGMLYPHTMLQPVVTLDPDGKSAKGRWRVFAMLGVYGESAIWTGGIYENEYGLENGIWKIKNSHYYPQYSGRYDQPGWSVDKESIPFHYDPMRAGTPIPPTGNQPVLKTQQSIATLTSKLNALAKRAQRLNDQSEVENLQHIYGYYVDRKMWDDVAELFTADATMELDQQGVYAGKKSIRHALNQFGPQGLLEGELNDHLQLQTIVDIAPDGLTAKSRGVELVMFGKHGVSGKWGEGIFENQYIKQNSVWRIKSMHVFQRLLTDYDKGWAKDAEPAAGPNRDFPPDRPPTKVYASYPAFYIPPFHFDNPVTSRPTRYPKGAAKAPAAPSQKSGVSKPPPVWGLRLLHSLFKISRGESMRQSDWFRGPSLLMPRKISSVPTVITSIILCGMKPPTCSAAMGGRNFHT